MKQRGILAGIAVFLLLLFYYLYLGSSVPHGQPLLVRLDGFSISSLKDAFNQSASSARLLVMLSPT